MTIKRSNMRENGDRKEGQNKRVCEKGNGKKGNVFTVTTNVTIKIR